MNGEVCVYIPVEEYRELVRAERDAELMKKLMKLTLSYSDIDTLQRMFVQQEEHTEE